MFVLAAIFIAALCDRQMAMALSPMPSRYVVPFSWDSAEIDRAGRDVIERALAEIGTIHLQALSVTGHADSAGSEEYNLALSLRRAEAVRDALVAGGVSVDLIVIARRGESDPEVQTPDGVPEPRNRRAEIIFQ